MCSRSNADVEQTRKVDLPYQYVADHRPELWIIEANATYRGWFTGGNQKGQWGNKEFLTQHIAGKGALGVFFATQLGGTIKVGDTPSMGWLLRGTPENPSKPGWGGQFVQAWKRPYARFNRLSATSRDSGFSGPSSTSGSTSSRIPKTSIRS